MAGWFIKPSDKTASDHQTIESTDHQEIWTCSMHPQIRRNEPGSCPICGMDLIPLETSGASDDPLSYQMSENAIKLANIQTIIVGKGDASKEIRLNGKVQVDERHAYSQSTHIPGRIEQLTINFTGEKVSRGQTLATIYSPQLVTAQEELLQAANIKESQPELFEAAKEKLRNWKISQGQIDRILAGGKALQRFTIQADVNGIVTKKMVELGDYVERGMPLYEISDLSKVWVLFDLYESELAWVKEGSEMEYTVNSLPGETFTGKISFIDPLINPQTRVASARVEVSNKDGRLKPEMFASGIVKNKIGKVDSQEIVIPKSAVLWTGKRSVVYIKEGSGFKMREITLGPALGDAYIVQDGLQTGEEVVSNGTFTVDAAVQLSGRPSMMNPEGGATSTGHDHGDMPMAQTGSKKIEVSKEMKLELENVLNHYLKLKDALVEDDFDTAKKEALTLSKLIQKIDQLKLSPEAKTGWDKLSLQLKTRSTQLSEAKDIEEIRGGFDKFSAEIIMLATIFQPTSKKLYVQHCPMADNERGADWLSISPDIKNPYFGSVMLNCGEVKKQIK
ncbi:MAG: efflux RND transporter periplasmic adaptor subunit [Flavobacteriaceae bacterium CG_4_8_14_3_um_filter_34_10]|nr:efflux RND transporter periplasmic adaptor subunit [Flavobacteriia bacterium]PIX08335.1 MAG: efflux RND transporter periplasmic adaptor subunit [Flavobacteriaceae bacterium CG_4_8_14_3_um_filter_34_10]